MTISDNKQRVALSLKKDTVKKLNKISADSGFSKSVIIELALKNYFRNNLKK
ncbi:TPA: CopG family transcriptional regulator [Streptococcus agalactiae]|jgi:metal-responsive CopG/Arc/MetJ family transcriptional regulator|nr:CopG family transcriptional regulator [Streptococcus agalactiae]HEN7678148.1 CopG family transcriptional regulator [Streptococcus agalactiae]